MSNPLLLVPRARRARGRVALIAVAAVVAASALTGCTARSTVVGEAYPQASRDSFTGACTDGGSTLEFCECVLDALEKTMSFAQFADLDAAMQNGTVTDKENAQLVELAQTCV